MPDVPYTGKDSDHSSIAYLTVHGGGAYMQTSALLVYMREKPITNLPMGSQHDL